MGEVVVNRECPVELIQLSLYTLLCFYRFWKLLRVNAVGTVAQTGTCPMGFPPVETISSLSVERLSVSDPLGVLRAFALVVERSLIFEPRLRC